MVVVVSFADDDDDAEAGGEESETRAQPPPPPPKTIDYLALSRSLSGKEEKRQDGEVSLSVEQSNALRATLGLRPLNASESSSASSARLAAERNFALAQASRREARRLAEIEAELSRARRRRLSRQAPRFEEQHEARKLEAERRAALLEEQEEEDQQLVGLEISSSAIDHLERGGGERILTLKDEPILTKDRGRFGLNDDSTDVLEHLQSTEAADRRSRERRARAERDVSRPASALDDDDESSFRVKIGKGSQVRLADQKHLTAAALARVSEATSTHGGAIEPADGDVAHVSTLGGQSSSSSGFREQREYLTADEARQMFRRRRRRDDKQHKKKKSQSLARVMPTADMGDAGDHGSRQSRERRALERAEAAAGEALEREAAREVAKHKHQALVDEALGRPRRVGPAATTTAPAEAAVGPRDSYSHAEEPSSSSSSSAARVVVVVEEKARFVEGVGDEDDDMELRASLARARAASSRSPRVDPAAAVNLSLETAAAAAKEEKATDEEGLVFTDTTEFTDRLNARLEERAAVVLASQQQQPPQESAPSGGTEGGEEQQGQEAEEGLEGIAEEEEEDDDSGGMIEFLHKQPLASSGMAATMALLKTSGDLGDDKARSSGEIMVGRARDQRTFEDGSHRDDDEERDVTFKGQLKPIKLEYRDGDGRLLTRKEAYRQLCWKFHGKGPSVKKRDKAAARLEATQRSIKQSNQAGSLAILQHAQQRTGQAFIPINNTTDMANNLVGNIRTDATTTKSSSSSKGRSARSSGSDPRGTGAKRKSSSTSLASKKHRPTPS